MKTCLLTLAILFPLVLFSAETELVKMKVVGKPALSESEIIAKRLPDGRYCAGIKVISNLEGISYDSFLGVTALEDKPGEDNIYLDPDERMLLIHHETCEPFKLIFSDVGIQLQPKQMWIVKIMAGEDGEINVSFLVTPKDSRVNVNGRDIGPEHKIKLKTGKHQVKIEQLDYATVEDSISVDFEKALFQYDLQFKPDMIFIEGGTFKMGSKEDKEHKVEVSSFYIGKYEVTFAEYDRYSEAINRNKKRDEAFGRGLRPVINVSWYEAVEYCNWLSETESLTPCYTINKTEKDTNNTQPNDRLKWIVNCNFDANGYRLPTEAEWEYAARGGKKSKNYKFSGSNNYKEVAWLGEERLKGSTHPIGLKKANELGIFDMTGNVNEYCWDWFDFNYYENSPVKNPKGAASSHIRCMRGGSWASNVNSVIREDFVYSRGRRSPDSYGKFSGFRIVKNAI